MQSFVTRDCKTKNGRQKTVKSENNVECLIVNGFKIVKNKISIKGVYTFTSKIVDL